MARPKTIRSLEDLTPDNANVNRGTERGASLLEKSLRNFGAGRSILVDRNGVVIAGNKTLEQAAAIGLKDVIVVQTDGRKLVAVQRVDLDVARDQAARALALADNRVAEIDLSWDAGLLAKQVEQLQEVDIGSFFTETEIARLLDQADEQAARQEAQLTGEIECPNCKTRFVP